MTLASRWNSNFRSLKV